VLVEHLLDLARVHVVAAPDDHFFLPVDDEEVPVLVEPGQVAAAEPAVRDRFGGRVVPPPVALHHVVAADRDLADVAGRHVLAELVDEAHLHALDRGTDGARLALPVGVVERGDG
jgi:hypothetical protein